MTNQMSRTARALSEEQVRVVLTAEHLSSRHLSDLMGVSMNTIQKIRRGYSYRDFVPDLPRWEDARQTRCERTPVCERCIHWLRGCSLGFPEAQRSMFFAGQCSAWRPADRAEAGE
jgi:transcriptional regulator with XRE-family HTH domain